MLALIVLFTAIVVIGTTVHFLFVNRVHAGRHVRITWRHTAGN